MKLKDFTNLKKNKRNKQFSLDIKKKKLIEFDVNIKDIMNMEIDLSKKLKKFGEI